MAKLKDACEGYQYSDSGLENLLWHYLNKIPDSCYEEIHAQYECGIYRTDAMIVHQGRKIGIEVDGKAFHDKTRDYYRDKEIILARQCDEIIRIPFATLHYYGRATLGCLGLWHPELFPKGLIDGSCLTREEAWEEIERIKSRDHEASNTTEEEMLKELSDDTEIYFIRGRSFGYAMSLEALLNNWDVTHITRFGFENFER